MIDEARFTIADVTDGWIVRIKRNGNVSRNHAITFIAHGTGAGERAFFTEHADARKFVKELKEHDLYGFIVRAQVILKVAR